MTLTLDHIETLAREATRGEWESVATRYATEKFDVCGPAGTLAIVSAEADARYIAAASPDVVLGLVAEVRRLREAVRGAVPRLEAAMERLGGNGEKGFV